jgi:hypothetical protein
MTEVVEETAAEPPEPAQPSRRGRRGRAIEPGAAAPAPPPAAPAAPPPPFYPSHRAPAPGLQIWDEPDPSKPAREIFPAGTEVQVLERWGDWAHVRRSDGAEGWVDGRVIEAR